MNFNDQRIRAFDISFYQGNPNEGYFVDFQKMKNYGVSFVVIKAGQQDYADPAFTFNWSHSKAVGLHRAAYWFLDKDRTPQSQANFFWSLLRNDPGEGPLVVDYEEGSSGNWQDLYDFIVELQRLSNYPNHKIWIYTGFFYWLNHSPLSLAQRQWFARYPLWLAWYADDPADVRVPDMWQECVLWQKGTPAIGLQVGVHSKEIDFNVFNGDENNLAIYFSGVEVPPPPTGDETMYVGTVKANATPYLNLRDAASVTGVDIGNLYPNDAIEADLLTNGWLHITKINGQAANGYASAAYIDYREVIVTPPPTVTKTFTLKLDGFKEFTGTIEPE